MSVLIDRLHLRKYLCEILKSDYVALLGQIEEFEDLSSCFGPLEDNWNSLSVPAQQALINLVELRQKFPSCKLDNQCRQIAKFENSTIWQEAFWRGFLKVRHGKVT
jgi:hypothetical protein